MLDGYSGDVSAAGEDEDMAAEWTERAGEQAPGDGEEVAVISVSLNPSSCSVGEDMNMDAHCLTVIYYMPILKQNLQNHMVVHKAALGTKTINMKKYQGVHYKGKNKYIKY